MDRITDFARKVEARGFPGIWIGNSLGRGRPTLDSLQVLTALAAVTSKVELGISVLQLPLRNPVELAHRVQSLQAMSKPADPRRRQRLDARRFRAARLRLRPPLPHLQKRPRDHGQGVDQPAGQRRHAVDLAGLPGRAADPDRRLAQPALDHLRRERGAGLDAVRPLQQSRGPRIRHAGVPRRGRRQCRPRQCSVDLQERPEIGGACQARQRQFHLSARRGAPPHQGCRRARLRRNPDRLAIRRDRRDRAAARAAGQTAPLNARRKGRLPGSGAGG